MKKKVQVRNKYQTYTYYLTEPEGKHFDPAFKPDLTPKQMLTLGVFGGDYFLGKNYSDLPKEWFAKAKLSDHGKDPAYNYFEINASLSLEEWQKKDWIHPNDPFGWFHWYCRYYLGRRIPEEDARQIRRWKMIFRHVAAVKKNCAKGDLACRRRQRQAILHWAIDSRKI